MAKKSTFKAVGVMGKPERSVTVRGGAIRTENDLVGVLNVEGLARRPLRLPYFFGVGKGSLSSVRRMGIDTLRSLGFAGIVTDEQSGKETIIEESTRPIGPYRWPGAARLEKNSGATDYNWGTWYVVQGRPGGGAWLSPTYGNVDVVSVDGQGYVRGLLSPLDMASPRYIQIPVKFDLRPTGMSDKEWCDVAFVGLRSLPETKERGPSFIKQARRRRPALPGVTERKKKVEGNPKKKQNPRSVISKYLKGL